MDAETARTLIACFLGVIAVCQVIVLFRR